MSDDASFLSRWARRKADVKSGKPVPPEAPLPVSQAASVLPTTALSTPIEAEPSAAAQAAAPEAPPQPTFDDVAALMPGDEISRFVAKGVDEDVKRAAIKKLFTDPHYNVMDGLDIYIDDYSLPDPIPMAMLRQMNQSKFLGLFAEEEAAEAKAEAEAQALKDAQAQAAATPAVENTATATSPIVEADAPNDIPAQDAGATAQPMSAVAAVPQTPDEDPDLQLQPDDVAGRPGAPARAGLGRT